jgi:Flp pilus assembly protein TadB
MLELLLLVLLVVLLFGAVGPRYYRGRGRRRVVREYDTF